MDKIAEIKKLESPPKVIRNLFTDDEISKFLKLYKDLPVTVHNKKQNVCLLYTSDAADE